jgi:hypothetical protein
VCLCGNTAVTHGLPAGHAYEQVSPIYKGGYGTDGITAVKPGGEDVVFLSKGGFGDLLSPGVDAVNFYVAHRGESGWSTSSVEPSFGAWADVSADMEEALGSGPVGPNGGVENHAAVEELFQLRKLDAPETAQAWETFGNIMLRRVDGTPVEASEEDASGDLCHLVLRAEPLLPEAVGTKQVTYDLSRGCDGKQSSLQLVGLTNNPVATTINPHCNVSVGLGPEYRNTTGNQKSDFDAISRDGREIFFTDSVEKGAGCEGVHQLFVRLGGARTIEISRPLDESLPFGGCAREGVLGEVPCDGASERASANFVGASEDGTRVFFTTAAELTADDKDGGSDLYMAVIGCPTEGEECEASAKRVTSLERVSRGANPSQSADVQGVVKVSRDGSHVYFVARGNLSERPNARGQAPALGADNLYSYDQTSGRLAFVADLCSGPGLSGDSEDPSCPTDLEQGDNTENDTGLWASNFPEAQTNSCASAVPACRGGQFLAFSTYAQLSASDTDNSKDVYRFDSATDSIVRVSLGVESGDANGNSDKFDATIAPGHVGGAFNVYTQYELGVRAISEDGSHIVFRTDEPLSQDATNGNQNVYEWSTSPDSSESVSMISSGSAEEDDESTVISASGSDVFFTTTQGLVPQDTDGAEDVYDAGRGFAPLPVSSDPCEADACQGPLADPAPLLVPGTISQTPGLNLPPPRHAGAKKKKTKKKPRGRKAKRRLTSRRGKGVHVGGRR